MIMPATYVSVWDETDEVRTNCVATLYPDGTLFISKIEDGEEPDGASALTEEYIELLDGKIHKTFLNVDTETKVLDGVAEDKISEKDLKKIKMLNEQHGWTGNKNT